MEASTLTGAWFQGGSVHIRPHLISGIKDYFADKDELDLFALVPVLSVPVLSVNMS